MAWNRRLVRGVAVLCMSCAFVGSAVAGGPPAPPPPAPKKWLPWYESGGFLSTEQHRGESSLFAPLWQSSVALLFFQGTGKYFEDDIQEGNFDIGFRKMHRSGWNFGLWGGYDVRDTEIDNIFHQISFGFEALSDKWDVRANGYVAVSDPAGSPELARVFLSGNNIFLTGGEEVPLSGFDGEIGYKVFSKRGGHGGLKDGPAPHGRSHELRVFAGGFYFDDDDALEEVAGPRARIEWRIDDVVRWLPGSRLTFEGEFQYDDVREDQWEGGVRFRVPFGGGGKDARATLLASLTPQERRMTERIVRDTDIVTAESEEENVFDTITGVRFDRAAVVPGGGDLQGTLNANGPNSLIVLNGGTTNGSFTVGPSQTLQGGASTIKVTGTRTGTTTGFTAPGAKPFIVQVLNQAVVTVDSNTHLAGLGITGAGAASGLANNDGIVPTADGVSNVAITDTMIMDMGGRGIDFDNAHNNVLIYHTSIANTGSSGIDFFNNNNNIAIGHTSITNTGGDGIDINNNNNGITIDRTTIANIGSIGIDFRDDNRNVTITNTSVANTGSRGIDFDDGSSNVKIAHTTITNVGSDGIEIEDNTSNVTITHTAIANAGSRGIQIDNNNSNITIAHTSIANTGNDGIDINNNNINITIDHTSVANTATFGIDFRDDNRNVTITNTSVADAGIRGIDFDNNNTATIANTTITNTGGDAIEFRDNNTLTINTTTFAGTIGDDLLDVDGVGNTLNGSGNVNNAVVADQFCEGAGGFTGTIEISGTVIVNGGPPCI